MERRSAKGRLSINSRERTSESISHDQNDGKDNGTRQQFKQISASVRFGEACARLERILASNVFQSQQKVFKGLTRADPCRMDFQFKYRLELLWTFDYEAVIGMTVSSMCWNYSNMDILGVGYGNPSGSLGFVCVWCIKNPSHPERIYEFDTSVTALDFSREAPNLLAVGFYSGHVIVMDVSSREKRVILQNSRQTSPAYSVVWQVLWVSFQSYHREDQELLVTADQAGRVCTYSRNADNFIASQIMRMPRVHGHIRGVRTLRQRRAGSPTPISSHAAALVLERLPEDRTMYLVGTDDGCVHRCSTNHMSQHLDQLATHRGPVYAVSFSPFCGKIFLTCGADCCVRIWCEGVSEPLVTLSSTEGVECAAWSPSHPTVVVSLSRDRINLWDIRRKIYQPMTATSSYTANGYSISYSTVQFTRDGLNLVVGDTRGNVHVFALKDMPLAPYFPMEALAEALKIQLITRADIWSCLVSLGGPFHHDNS